MAGVEDVITHLDNTQVWIVARCVEDPTRLVPVGFGDENMIDDEMTKGRDGRMWNDHGLQWVGRDGNKDGLYEVP